MIPLRDVIPSRTTPYITVTIIVLNAIAWLFAAIFGGLMAFWCIFNYERSLTVHYFLMFFALLLAVIHWHDHFAGHLRWMSPIVNTVPFVVLMITAVLSRSRENA